MDLIESILARYAKEYDYYDQVAHRAADMLRSNLDAAGIRSIVTSRAKSVSRLAEKCRQRNKKHPYESVDEIYSDIVDLVSCRSSPVGIGDGTMGRGQPGADAGVD